MNWPAHRPFLGTFPQSQLEESLNTSARVGLPTPAPSLPEDGADSVGAGTDTGSVLILSVSAQAPWKPSAR